MRCYLECTCAHGCLLQGVSSLRPDVLSGPSGLFADHDSLQCGCIGCPHPFGSCYLASCTVAADSRPLAGVSFSLKEGGLFFSYDLLAESDTQHALGERERENNSVKINSCLKVEVVALQLPFKSKLRGSALHSLRSCPSVSFIWTDKSS